MKKTLSATKLVLVILFSGVIIVSSNIRTMAQSPSPRPASRRVHLVLPELPPGPPPGGRIRGGAKRGSCPKVEPDLTALVPFMQTDSNVVNVWGLTTMERPTIWIYVPYTKSSGYPAEFVVLNEESNPVYQTAISLPDVPGVMGVSVGAMASPLAIGKRYRWFFNISCNPQTSNSPIYVEGVVHRITPNRAIAQQLQIGEPKQQIAIYANNGIWYDALTTLAHLRQQNPQDAQLQTEWKDLLEAINLGDIVQKPLVSNAR